MNKIDQIPDLTRLSFWWERDRQEIKQVNRRVCEQVGWGTVQGALGLQLLDRGAMGGLVTFAQRHLD